MHDAETTPDHDRDVRVPTAEPDAAADEQRVLLVSGRRVGVRIKARGRSGRTIVLCHPAPGSAAFDPQPALTKARGVTLLGLDRPGYGLSDPVPAGSWATVASAADDIAQIVAERSLDPIGVVGWSAGGRVALALAARYPALVDRVAVIGTPAPQEEVPWVPEEHAQALEALRDLDAERVHGILAEQFAPMTPAGASDPAILGLLDAGDADATVLADESARTRLATMVAAGFAQGAVGLAADIAGFSLRPWGFELGSVRAAALLVYGAHDPVANARHAHWYATQLANARLEIVPDVGHLLVIPAWQRVLDHVAPTAT